MTNETPPVPSWIEGAFSEAWSDFKKRATALRITQDLRKYERDPVGFCTNVLGERFTDDICAVMESVRDNPITIARSANGPGKSHGAARIAIWFYKVFEDSKVIMAAAPPFENIKRILWGEVGSVIRRNMGLFAGDTINSLAVLRHKEHYMVGSAIPTSGTREQRISKFSGKHAPHLLFIVDEGDAVPDEVFEGIEGCMSGGMARLLIMFNPKAESGYVYRLERDGRANVINLSALTHPNVVSGEDVIPGAVSREITVRRINEWTRELMPSEKCDADCFDLPDFLVGTVARATNGVLYPPLPSGKRKIEEPEFFYKVLGQYPAQSEQQLISRVWIDNARARYDSYASLHGELPPPEISPIMGVDLAEFGVDSNVSCVRYGGFVPRMFSWGSVDPDMSARVTLDQYILRKCTIAFVDATGVGAGVAPSITRMSRERNENDIRVIGIKVASSPSKLIKSDKGEFFQMRDQLWWAVREWLRTDPTAMLPPDERLLEELRIPRYSFLNGKIKVTNKDEMRKTLKRSPDRADALCLTFVPIERPTILRLDL